MEEHASYGVPNSPDEPWGTYPRWWAGAGGRRRSAQAVLHGRQHAKGACACAAQRPMRARRCPRPRSTTHCRFVLEPTQHEMLIVEDLEQDIRCARVWGGANGCGGGHAGRDQRRDACQRTALCMAELASACAAHAGGSEPPACPLPALSRGSFKNSLWVTGPPHLRFYAAAPLVSTNGGHRYGTL